MITKIAMYQGMRLGEICQLRKKDIKKVDNVLCIDINVENDKKVKTRNSIRTIPVHPSIYYELLNFIENINDDENLFSYDSKEFSEFYRKILIVLLLIMTKEHFIL